MMARAPPARVPGRGRRPRDVKLRLPCLALIPVSCASLSSPGSEVRLVATASGATATLEAAADDLATFDAVFLGEIHDSDAGHRVQLELTELLLVRRPDLVLSLEMFERDVQGALDDYLAGRSDEAAFLAAARPWPNYREHYRPAVELVRARRLPVLAADVPRPLAARVVEEGPTAVLGEPFA